VLHIFNSEHPCKFEGAFSSAKASFFVYLKKGVSASALDMFSPSAILSLADIGLGVDAASAPCSR
jgi:hypothetical protein